MSYMMIKVTSLPDNHNEIMAMDDIKPMGYEKPLLPYDPMEGNDSNEGLMTFIIVFTSFLSVTIIFSLVSLIIYYCKKRFQLSEDEIIRQEENQVYLQLDSEEQELYFQSKDFLSSNPYLRNDLMLSQNLSIQEKGINAWEFVKDSMLTNNDLLILNKYELNFFKKFECSSQTNLPIPNKNEVYYFESKIYNLPDGDNTKISIGMGIKPYPWFRLPGRHAHSISYDSDGYRRHNQPFNFTNDPPFPKLIEGDVVGIGYRVRSGTIFFTRNGKKLSESKIGGHIKNFKIPNNGQLYPIIGANNLCSIHVNLGQMGFVFIEGNVKKWGFAPLEGSGPAPPAYNKFNGDILLERSEIDEGELSERENDFPPDFWQVQSDDEYEYDKFSYNAYNDVNSNDERITMHSLIPPVEPPSYSDDAVPVEDTSDSLPEQANPHQSSVQPAEQSVDHSSDHSSDHSADHSSDHASDHTLEILEQRPSNSVALEAPVQSQPTDITPHDNQPHLSSLGDTQDDSQDDAYSERFQTVDEISDIENNVGEVGHGS